MDEGQARSGAGVSLWDAAAVVAGAGVAALHLRGVLAAEPVVGPGWVVVWGTFAWVALSASGPFVFAARRFAVKVPGHPLVGDWLWAMLGAPWVVAAVFQRPRPRGATETNQPLALALSVGLLAAVLAATAVVWATWVRVSPEKADRTFAGPWTNTLGLILAVAWPVQCGVGMVVIG